MHFYSFFVVIFGFFPILNAFFVILELLLHVKLSIWILCFFPLCARVLFIKIQLQNMKQVLCGLKSTVFKKLSEEEQHLNCIIFRDGCATSPNLFINVSGKNSCLWLLKLRSIWWGLKASKHFSFILKEWSDSVSSLTLVSVFKKLQNQ